MKVCNTHDKNMWASWMMKISIYPFLIKSFYFLAVSSNYLTVFIANLLQRFSKTVLVLLLQAAINLLNFNLTTSGCILHLLNMLIPTHLQVHFQIDTTQQTTQQTYATNRLVYTVDHKNENFIFTLTFTKVHQFSFTVTFSNELGMNLEFNSYSNILFYFNKWMTYVHTLQKL